MFRLLKLAAYGLIGYFLYEFAQGMLHSSYRVNRGARRELERARRSPSGGRKTLTGSGGADGGGQREQTLDATGASIPHQVGRGVIPT